MNKSVHMLIIYTNEFRSVFVCLFQLCLDPSRLVMSIPLNVLCLLLSFFSLLLIYSLPPCIYSPILSNKKLLAGHDKNSIDKDDVVKQPKEWVVTLTLTLTLTTNIKLNKLEKNNFNYTRLNVFRKNSNYIFILG